VGRKTRFEKWLEKEQKQKLLSIYEVTEIHPDGIMALSSDYHIGSKFAAEDEILDFYDYCKDRGVKHHILAGDLIDGVGVYKGQYNDLKIATLEGQADYFKEFVPKDGTKKYFITGNHEDKADKMVGISSGKLMERKDMKYCGHLYSRFKLDGEIVMDVVHPKGGSHYTVGYSLQKYLRQTDPKFYPDILNFGHFHKHVFANVYGVEGIMNGGFEYANDFIIRQQVGTDISGWIIEYKVTGKSLKMKLELVKLL